ncbi:nucleotidyltransferase family protein [Thermus oshimai]|uniref:nucleotidyltransferase family protein n=1 Tax=Thermus oshimai TaxID=56957 RepID=UPI000475D6BC|nr:nucleotidyltransferase domain-containing protein [Thermus oshimai]
MQELLKRHRVKRLCLVGSHARGEAQEASDLDLLVEFLPMPPEEHASHYLDLMLELQELLGLPVDLLETQSLQNPFVRARIEEHLQEIYAA